MALVITIIVLLILAGITIGTLTVDNGILTKTNEAKTETEIAGEKEVLQQATIQVIGKSKYGSIEKEDLQSALDNIAGEGETKVSQKETNFEVLFTKSSRYYEIDEEGNIGDYQICAQDKAPGDITKDANGNTLDGSIEKPYEINCIEDLVSFSNMTSGSGYKLEDNTIQEITAKESFEDKYVVLKRTLNFKSAFSYIDSERTDFGNINGDDTDGNSLMTEMLNGTGFKPISGFSGYFNGNNYEIQNIYINREDAAGFLLGGKEIKNLGITGNITSTKSYAHGIGNASLIENCWNKSNVTAGGSTNSVYNGAAGIGRASSKIINCYNSRNIACSEYAGGIVGGTAKEISNCYNTGNVSGKFVGGISWKTVSKITNSYNTGIVSGFQAGGIVGRSETDGVVISNCFNVGDVYHSNYDGCAGGIVASERGTATLNKCYYLKTDNVTQAINGIADDTTVVTSCTSVDEITAEELNNNINTITHEDEWVEWIDGENYPILKIK